MDARTQITLLLATCPALPGQDEPRLWTRKGLVKDAELRARLASARVEPALGAHRTRLPPSPGSAAFMEPEELLAKLDTADHAFVQGVGYCWIEAPDRVLSFVARGKRVYRREWTGLMALVKETRAPSEDRRHAALRNFLLMPPSRTGTEAVLRLAVDRGESNMVREAAVMALGSWLSLYDQATKKRVQHTLRLLAKGEGQAAPDPLLRMVRRDHPEARKTVPEPFALAPEIRQTLRVRAATLSEARLWELIRCIPALGKNPCAGPRLEAARELIRRGDLRAVDVLVEHLDRLRTPSHQWRVNILAHLERELGQPFSPESKAESPDFEAAVRHARDWWAKHRSKMVRQDR